MIKIIKKIAFGAGMFVAVALGGLTALGGIVLNLALYAFCFLIGLSIFVWLFKLIF